MEMKQPSMTVKANVPKIVNVKIKKFDAVSYLLTVIFSCRKEQLSCMLADHIFPILNQLVHFSETTSLISFEYTIANTLPSKFLLYTEELTFLIIIIQMLPFKKVTVKILILHNSH